MTPIFVWAVVTDERGVLLVPAREADGWLLPGGPLRDDDESVESAIVRELEHHFGVRPAEELHFLDTQYEQRPDGRLVVHNLFHVPSDLLGDAVGSGGAREWLDPADAATAMLPTWLSQGLATLFGAAPAAAQFDMAEIARALGAGTVTTAPVVIVTGPAAAGKSTVAREICRRFPRAAHIDVDMIRWQMVVSGYVRPEEVYGSQPEEALRQLALAARNATALARNFAGESFLAVIDTVIETREEMDIYLDELAGLDVRLVTLLPQAEALAARDAGRPPDQFMGERCEELRRIIETNGETRGLRLDTSAWDAEATVDIVLQRFDEARVEAT